MHDRSPIYLHERFLLRPTAKQTEQRSTCPPPWRYTQLPVELFDLMTYVERKTRYLSFAFYL